jgi:hypothetical protein
MPGSRVWILTLQALTAFLASLAATRWLRCAAGTDDALERATRLSFAAFQDAPQSSPQATHRVLQQRIIAMEGTDTAARLDMAIELQTESRSVLAAKAALRSLNLGS